MKLSVMILLLGLFIGEGFAWSSGWEGCDSFGCMGSQMVGNNYNYMGHPMGGGNRGYHFNNNFNYMGPFLGMYNKMFSYSSNINYMGRFMGNELTNFNGNFNYMNNW